MTGERMASTLEQVATLMELKGENSFKIRAYRQGADIIRNFPGDIISLAANRELAGIKGIGEALREKCFELATTGRLTFLEDLQKEFPTTIFELFNINGLGPKKIKALYDSLGVDSIAALTEACKNHSVANLPGFGDKTETKILAAIQTHLSFANQFLLASVTPIANHFLDLLRSHPEVSQVAIAGSFRRAKEVVSDLDFIVATKEPALVCEDFTTLPEIAEIIACGETKASIRLNNGLQCDLRAVSNEQFPFTLQYFSGSKEHNVALRSLALQKGYSLNEYALTPVNDTPPPPTIHTESEIYHFLGLHTIPPELRENRGEIERATQSPLPNLIEWTQLRGTFHSHTTASDGANTLEEMANEAIELGLQYLGISDHSKSSVVANGLNEARLLHQIDEIRLLNASFSNFHLFAGSEVDILKDGSLDFSDEILSQLDFTVASVHNQFNLSEKEMTDRICRAMENPYVTMIGHLTGRLLLKRAPYAIDHKTIIECAADTHTIIELNCSPRRLDMDWRWWQFAQEKGVLCSINPDAHHINGLHHLALGTRIARKGGLTADNVLNTRALASIQEFFSTPKSQRVLPPRAR